MYLDGELGHNSPCTSMGLGFQSNIKNFNWFLVRHVP